jgi:hypothetical protein
MIFNGNYMYVPALLDLENANTYVYSSHFRIAPLVQYRRYIAIGLRNGTLQASQLYGVATSTLLAPLHIYVRYIYTFQGPPG